MTAALTNAKGESATLENPNTLTVCVAEGGESIDRFAIRCEGGVLHIRESLIVPCNDISFPQSFCEPIPMQIVGDFSGSTYPEAKS